MSEQETAGATPANPSPAGGSVLSAPLSARAEGRLLKARLEREERDAKWRQRLARRDAAGERRKARAADRAGRRARLSAACARWLSEHAVDGMFAPIIGVPAWLSWDGMAVFGEALFGPPGRLLPVLSETAMWVFDLQIVRVRHRNRRHPEHPAERVWHLYAGMAAFALICALLNFMHGLTGPIPGSIRPGAEAAFVYALISVSGLACHQIVSLGMRSRKKPATKKASARPATKKNVAPLMAAKAAGNVASVVAGAPGGDRGPGTGHDEAAGAAAAAAAGGARSDAEVIDLSKLDLSQRGAAKRILRKFWDEQVAKGKIPTGGEMNAHIGKESGYSLGKRYAQEWRAELAADGGKGEDADDEPGGVPAAAGQAGAS